MQPTLQTHNLTLQLLSENDSAFIVSLLNSEGWQRFIGDRNVHTKKDAVAYIKRIIQSPLKHYWVVRLKTTKKPIGVVTYLKRDTLEYFDIGFAFLPAYIGKGYACEAASKVLYMIETEEQQQHLLAITIPENKRSIGLLTKLGFGFKEEMQEEGERIFVYSKSFTR